MSVFYETYGERPRIAVASVLELPNKRTTREMKAESLTIASSLQMTSEVGGAAEVSDLSADGLRGTEDEKHRRD